MEPPVDQLGTNTGNFIIDFSALGGTVTGLTIAEFQNITVGTDPDDWGYVAGNGTVASPARVDVEAQR